MNNIFKLIIASFLLASCNSNTETVSVPNNFDSQKIVSAKNHSEKILAKKMVADAVNVPTEKIEVHIENKLLQKGQYTVLYSWPTGKSISVSEKYSIPEYHSMGIGFINTDDAYSFEEKYGSNAGLQQRINQMASDSNFSKEIATAEAQYLSDYAQRRNVEKLQNVATAAYWETPVNALHVLVDKVSFTITTNFGDDENLAKRNAIRLVNEVLNK